MLITRDFTLHNALLSIIGGISTYRNMDELIYYINSIDAAMKYLFIIDNRFPYLEIAKVEKTLRHSNINAIFLVMQMSKVPYNILGYSHYNQMKIDGKLSNIVNSITYCIDNNDVPNKISHLRYLGIPKLEVDIMKISILEGDMKSVAKRMNMPVKKIYLHRELLYKRLGLPNVNQAFLYILNHYPDDNFNRNEIKVGGYFR